MESTKERQGRKKVGAYLWVTKYMDENLAIYAGYYELLCEAFLKFSDGYRAPVFLWFNNLRGENKESPILKTFTCSDKFKKLNESIESIK